MTAWTEGDVQVNDITIHYYRTGDKNNPSVLLLHGITDSGQCWSRMAADLAGSYDVIMTDARGHGHSGTSAAEVSIALLAEDAVAVIGALELQKPFLVGHSMGAVTAATVAANYPDVVRAIVLEDPPLLDKPPSQTDINKALGVTNEEQSAPSGWQWLFELRALPREERIARGHALNPTWVEEETIPWPDSKAEMNIAFLEPAHAAVLAFRWREIMARIQCPILLITGDPQRGSVVPAEAASGTPLETGGGGAYCWGWSQHPPRQVCRNDGGRQGVFEQGVRTKGREAHDMTACADGVKFLSRSGTS